MLPIIPEEPAQWAERAVDPCTVLALPTVKAVLAATTAPRPVRPRECEVPTKIAPYPPASVQVGAALDHPSRAARAPVTIGHNPGQRGYLWWNKPDRGGTGKCELALPLSATRALTITTPLPQNSPPQDSPASACALAVQVATAALTGFLRPESLTRPGAERQLRRTSACELLHAAIPGTGLPFTPDAATSQDPDHCNAHSPSHARMQLAFTAGDPVKLARERPGEHRGASIVPLPEATGVPVTEAKRVASSDQCDLSWANQDSESTVWSVSVLHTARGGQSGDPCANATTLATALRQRLATAPQQPLPPAPPTLGIPADRPDEQHDPSCQLDPIAVPTGCGPPDRKVNRPSDLNALQNALTTDQAPDHLCRLLRGALGAQAETEVAHVPAPGQPDARNCSAGRADRSMVATLTAGTGQLSAYLCSKAKSITVGNRAALDCTQEDKVTQQRLHITLDPNSKRGVLNLTVAFRLPRGIAGELPEKGSEAADYGRQAAAIAEALVKEVGTA
ncbi:hypothetical protein M8C13_07085 [Crossiella sp. SN42]|uniref:hypothetical protein n=1 Tax=Crossiella sp. SN42 TaxID=2944808 RepID=UPI00207C1F1E|nr:hypothetical protein [Crossiella sp. SN42]MCO1575521.1 hypothetical protein [Crossiella sp. SN42]